MINSQSELLRTVNASAVLGISMGTVIRTWIDRDAIAEAPGLTHDQPVLFSQTVGYPKR